ncbi:AglZ/HisF2 family acetamidino modification protein [Shinella sp. H4-D48]|uniref:AglZ/HisF2 family acetamidino modification protein n=1 Tax=Shinella sp. H4-D48 TaxID=2925841 RepID=UPI001F52C1CA|nr:AglZ/HisF2 family acetamidino modification protein [Shinella sp. H4-D48]UNK38236.1 AglZ/HisF2 family acetamidino modification protein [Shinella sp. H4-D48]
MLKSRVIPILLLRERGVVKTTKFRNAKYIGDPINAIRIFNDKEVDELIVLDIDASRMGHEPDYEMIEALASECFMPLAYGGGIHCLRQAEQLFRLGVEKLCMQSSVLEDQSIIPLLASHFGSQAITVSVDVKRDFLGRPRLYSSRNGKILTSNWLEFARHAADAGAGEILLNAVDRDGTLAGPDLELINNLSKTVNVPMVACGGIASLDDMRNSINAGAHAVAAGAFFVFNGPHRAVLITYPSHGELETLRG